MKGKPLYYEPDNVKDARAKLAAHLAAWRPESPLRGPIRFTNKWCFARGKKHSIGEYKTTRPDCDNSVKLVKDVMTKLGFWADDAHVASEISEKFWNDVPGIYIKIEEI